MKNQRSRAVLVFFFRGSVSEASSDKSSVQIPSPGSSAFKEVTENRPSEPAIIGGSDTAFIGLEIKFSDTK